jgi:hypothetical protein
MNEIMHVIERHYHHEHAARQVDGIYTQLRRRIGFTSGFDQNSSLLCSDPTFLATALKELLNRWRYYLGRVFFLVQG